MPVPPPRPRRVTRWTGVALLLVGLAAAPMPPAAGQEDGPVELRLVSQPVWHRPGDELGIRLRILNSGLVPVDGFLVSLTAHPVAGTRSALHESFEGNAGAITSATSKKFTNEIEAGGAITVSLDEVEPPPSLADVSEAGAYPLTIGLSDANGVIPYDSLTTPLILYPEQPDVPLNLALVMPLNDVPSKGPDGVFRDPLGSESVPLQEAISERGWLTGVVDALDANAGELPDLQRTETVRVRRKNGRGTVRRTRTVSVPQRGVHLGLAPTPRLVEELADMAAGFKRAGAGQARVLEPNAAVPTRARALLSTFRQVLGEEGVQTLLVPYSFPDLPALARYAPERIELELEEGTEALAAAADTEPSAGWLFPPAGRLGAQSLEELRFAAPDTAEHVLFEPDSFDVPETVDPPGCPVDFASFACPVSVRTSAGATTGLVGDQGLQDRFIDLVQGGGGPLELQNFFAETATIRQEVPSVENRVVQVTVPSLWHPSPAISRRLFAGLRQAPWLKTVTPAEAVDLRKPVRRTESFVEAFPPLPTDPGPELFEEIAEVTDFIDDFRRMGPPEQMVQRLRRNTLVAESRIWWGGTALSAAAADYIARSEDIAREEMSKVTVAGPDEINLTSKEGEIPLVVANETDFPTTVRIMLTSPERDLVLDPAELPAQRIEAGGSFQFTVEAAVRSSGIFQMEVLVATPQGELDIARRSITVRSTAFNVVALGLTIGALVFLVVFYLMRVLRRRRVATT